MPAVPPIRLLSARDVRAVELPLADVMALIERVYLLDAHGGVEVPMKIGVHPHKPENILHAMPAWVEGAEALGMKWLSYFPGNAQRGLPDYSAVIVLNDPASGLPLCIMDGMHVTFLRTAACAAVAARHLLPVPPQSLGLIGCGRLARWTLRLMLCACPTLERVFVASRTASSRAAFCAEMERESAARLTAVNDVRCAVEGVDVVISSIPPGSPPPVRAQWLSPGSLFIPLDILNSWRDEVLSVVPRVIADDPANFRSRLQGKRPSALASLPAGVALQAVLAGAAPKPDQGDRSLAVICGIASTDVIVAREIYRRACAANLGTMFTLTS